ncbi:MAG: hypothetical protein ABIW76_19570 [Fibrobacteria bacterium]
MATLELSIFSGRMPPKAVVMDSVSIDSLYSGLSRVFLNPVPRDDVHSPESVLGYTGLTLGFFVPTTVPGGPFNYQVGRGYVCEIKAEPLCWADSGQSLERLALGIAFRHTDLSQTGGSMPISSVACLVPENLRPMGTACATSFRARKPWAKMGGFTHGPRVDAAGRAERRSRERGNANMLYP